MAFIVLSKIAYMFHKSKRGCQTMLMGYQQCLKCFLINKTTHTHTQSLEKQSLSKRDLFSLHLGCHIKILFFYDNIKALHIDFTLN